MAKLTDTIIFGDLVVTGTTRFKNDITLDTQINSDFIPDVDGTYSLGSATKRFAHVYTQGIDIYGELTIVDTDNSNTFTLGNTTNSTAVQITAVDNSLEIDVNSIPWLAVTSQGQATFTTNDGGGDVNRFVIDEAGNNVLIGSLAVGDNSHGLGNLSGQGIIISNDDGGSVGRIRIDVEDVTSGYNTRIAQNNSGFIFESESNARPFKFYTGSSLTEVLNVGLTSVDVTGTGTITATNTTTNVSVLSLISAASRSLNFQQPDGADVNSPWKIQTSNALTVTVDATDALNVDSSGKLSLTSGIGVDAILDEDNLVSNSSLALATQQSIKAYVDNTTGRLTSNNTWTGTNYFEGTGNQIYIRETDAGVDEKLWTITANGETFVLQSRTDAGVFTANLLEIDRNANLYTNGGSIYLDADKDSRIYSIADDRINIDLNGTEVFDITTSRLELSGTAEVRFANGSAASPALNANADQGTGVYWPSAGNFGISVSSAQIINVDSAGVDIIGTLDVQGSQILMNTGGNPQLLIEPSTTNGITHIEVRDPDRAAARYIMDLRADYSGDNFTGLRVKSLGHVETDLSFKAKGLNVGRIIYSESFPNNTDGLSTSPGNITGDLGEWAADERNGGTNFQLDGVTPSTLIEWQTDKGIQIRLDTRVTSPVVDIGSYRVFDPDVSIDDDDPYSQTRIFMTFAYRNYSNDSITEQAVCEVYDGTNWIEVWRDYGDDAAATVALAGSWRTASIDLSPYANGSFQVRFFTTFGAGAGDYFQLGEILFHEAHVPIKLGNVSQYPTRSVIAGGTSLDFNTSTNTYSDRLSIYEDGTTSDWFMLSKTQDNGFRINDGSGGVQVFYNGSVVSSFDNDGLTADALGIGAAPGAPLHVTVNSGEGTPSLTPFDFVIQDNNSGGNAGGLLLGGTAGTASLYFGDTGQVYDGGFIYSNTDRDMTFRASNADKMVLSSSALTMETGVSFASDYFNTTTNGFTIGDTGARASITASGSGLVINNSDNSNISIQSQGNTKIQYQLSTNKLVLADNTEFEVPTGVGTIAGSTWNNGWVRIGNSTIGWAFDNNEIYAAGNGTIGTISGSGGNLTLSPDGNIVANADITGNQHNIYNFDYAQFGNGASNVSADHVVYTYYEADRSADSDQSAVYGYTNSTFGTDNLAADRNRIGVYGYSDLTDGSTSANTYQLRPIGVYGRADVSSGYTDNIYAGYFESYVFGGAGAEAISAYGVYARARLDNAGSQANSLYGIFASALVTGDVDQTLSNAYSIRGLLDVNAGTVTTARIFEGYPDVEVGSTIGTLYGIDLDLKTSLDITPSNLRPIVIIADLAKNPRSDINGWLRVGGDGAFSNAASVLQVDDTATSGTGLTVNGGGGGGSLALFRRNIGADTSIEIHGGAGDPTITFDVGNNGADWSIGAADSSTFVIGTGGILTSAPILTLTSSAVDINDVNLTGVGDITMTGSTINLSGAMNFSGGNVGFKNGTNGYVGTNTNGSNSGYLEFFAATTGTRTGYIGFSDGTSHRIYSDDGSYFNFNVTPRVSGTPVAILSGAAFTGNISTTGTMTADQYISVNTSSRDKIRVWSSGNYAIGMQTGFTYGYLNNDYAMTFQMNNDTDRGFWWGHTDHTNAQGAMSLTVDGKLYVGNTISVGGNVVWHPGNDGAGSGLDADTVDGIQATQFLRSDTSTIKSAGTLKFDDSVICSFGTGNDFEIFFNGSNTYMDMNAGNLYIRDGTTTKYTFDDNGSFIIAQDSSIFNPTVNANSALRLSGSYGGGISFSDTAVSKIWSQSSGSEMHFSTNDGTAYDIKFDGNGNFTATGNVTANSDITLKTIIGVIDRPSLIDELNVIEFDWKDGRGRSIGIIAQEVKNTAPELVITGTDGILSVDYGKYAVAALYEEKKKREALENKIERLEVLVQNLMEKINGSSS
jgi:hypothetical protein